jgi:hypothetical protein
MEEQKYCFVQFKCSFKTVPGKCSLTPGEELRVIGSIPELGIISIIKVIGMSTRVKKWSPVN